MACRAVAREASEQARLCPTGYDGQPSLFAGLPTEAALAAKVGGAEGSRTPDLLIANEALSQLSYGPRQNVTTNVVTLNLRRVGAI